MANAQEVEITFKVKMKYPSPEEMLSQYGHADVGLAVLYDWDTCPELFFEQDWELITVAPAVRRTEPTLEDHTIRLLEQTDG